ncbi:hypothetical protein L1049_026463 [Liquidambar formosana]|uniref:PsbP C-terminal domain-containing protein n=1 Tax=Liquidambar formosana TaxID=63359 RepID=A0AAP0NEY1_LIQFO
MASVASLYSPSPLSRFCNFTPSSHKKGIAICRKQRVLCCKSDEHDQIPIPCFHTQQQCGTQRRDVMLQMVFTAFSFPVIVSNALAESVVAEDFRIYSDEANKFKITIPKDWQVGAGEGNGFKSVTAFYPEDASTSNVSVVITGLGPDFTRIESFGKVEAFAETLVGGLDRSWQRPPGVTAKLIDCKSSKGFYYIEYSLQNPGESCRHIYSAIGMASNGWYNRLYTVTGQFMEEESDKYSSMIEKAVASFGFI